MPITATRRRPPSFWRRQLRNSAAILVKTKSCLLRVLDSRTCPIRPHSFVCLGKASIRHPLRNQSSTWWSHPQDISGFWEWFRVLIEFSCKKNVLYIFAIVIAVTNSIVHKNPLYLNFEREKWAHQIEMITVPCYQQKCEKDGVYQIAVFLSNSDPDVPVMTDWVVRAVFDVFVNDYTILVFSRRVFLAT